MAQRTVINPNKSVNASPFYSPAIRADNVIYVSGQGPIDPETGQLGEDIALQTRQALENCSAILQASGTNLNNVVKVSIFLNDMKGFDEMNKVYTEYFPENPPARSCISVNSLPGKDWKIEIEMICLL